MIAQEADLDTHSRSCGSRFHNKEEKEKFCENMDYDLGTSSDSDSDEEFFFEADAFSGGLKFFCLSILQ
jgi:hypothetical protein